MRQVRRDNRGTRSLFQYHPRWHFPADQQKTTMTDAQHAAHLASLEASPAIKGQIEQIVRANPGITYRGIIREYQSRHGQPLAQATAGGRVAELAAEGIIYAKGSIVEDGRKLSRYYYEPDPEWRFAIRMEKENERFLKWMRAADKFSDRLPTYILSGIRDRATLLASTMEMVSENRER